MANVKALKQYRYMSHPVSDDAYIALDKADYDDLLHNAGMTHKQLAKRLGISAKRLMGMVEDGRFPKYAVRYLNMVANIRMLAVIALHSGILPTNGKELEALLDDVGLSYANAAKLLGVRTETVRRWVLKDDRIPEWAGQFMGLFCEVGLLFYATYGEIKRRDFVPATKRWKLYPKGTKMEPSPRSTKGRRLSEEELEKRKKALEAARAARSKASAKK